MGHEEQVLQLDNLAFLDHFRGRGLYHNGVYQAPGGYGHAYHGVRVDRYTQKGGANMSSL